MNRTRLLLLAAMAALIGAFFAFDLSHFFTLDALKAEQAAITAYRVAHPVLAASLYAALSTSPTPWGGCSG